MNYPSKEHRLDQVKDIVDTNLADLHPTDRAEALREVEKFAGEKAAAQEDVNDRDGVPERTTT